MKNQDYQNSIMVNTTAQVAFLAITTQINKWWSTDYQGAAGKTDEEFTVRFGETFMTMRIGEVLPNERIVWHCVGQNQVPPPGTNSLKNPAEWVGTTIIWTITSKENGTDVTIHHPGLTPMFECWAICQQGWNQTLDSLKLLLETGTGLPFGGLSGEYLENAQAYDASH